MSKESDGLLNFPDDLKIRLLDCVIQNDQEGIKQLVDEHGVGILHADYEEFDKPILHVALVDKCNYVRSSTVRYLIDLGADIYKKTSRHCEAIHSAVSGQNPQLLKTIVGSIQNQDRLNATAQGNTALNFLIKYGNNKSNSFMDCLQILLDAGVDVNIADEKAITPILWACVKGYKDVIKAILECGRAVDIDTHTYQDTTARTHIAHYCLYEGNTVPSPLWYIQIKDEQGFFSAGEIPINDEYNDGTLLQQACERGLVNVVRYLINRDADVYKTTQKNEKVPLEIAALIGNHEIFKLLLPKYDPLPEQILTTILKNMPLYEGANDSYKECLNTLLKSNKSVPVNERSNNRNTPLHYACMTTDPVIPLKLLENGASLANRNDFDSIPIEDIDPEILEDHFNECITVRESGSKQRIIINFDYTTILPATDKEDLKARDEEASLIDVTEPTNETDVIRVISETAELRHLLIHPLIATFIRIKWHKMRWFFWIHLVLFILFAIFFFVYVFIPVNDHLRNYQKVWINILWSFLIITYVILLLKEISQFTLSWKTYCNSLSNIFEMAMLVVCFYPIFCKSANGVYKQFSAIAMVMIALDLMVLGSQHPQLSTYVVVLRTVAKNFFFFLLWYAVLIFAFALGFYAQYHRNDQNFDNTTYVAANTDEHYNHVLFGGVGLTLIKTVAMLAGEFDANSIDFNSFWNRVIFLLFVLMISIILFNLLNGLAVSDTQQIKSEAEIVAYAERVNYIAYLENIIRNNPLPGECLLRGYLNTYGLNFASRYLSEQISLFPHYLPEKEANVKLYLDGLVIESQPRTKGWFDVLARVHIYEKTIKRVEQLLHERSSETNVQEQVKSLQDIMDVQTHVIKQQRRKVDRLKARQTYQK
ncbi:pain [Trypoxylus dichotomus]